MGYISESGEVFLVGYLTQLGRQKFISNQLGSNPVIQFTLSDCDINYELSSNLNPNKTFNIPESGFIPNLTGDIDFCFPVVSKGIDNSYTSNFLVANEVFNEIASYTAFCDIGRVGNPFTSTLSATGTSKSDAYNNAYNLAKLDAMSKVVCGWQSVQTATAQCQPGFTGATTNGSGTYVSYVSLNDAIANANKLAQQDAMSKLVCNPVDKTPNYVATADYRCKGSNSPLNGTPSDLNVGNVVQRRYTNNNPNVIVADQWRDEGTNAVGCPLPTPPVSVFKVAQNDENSVTTTNNGISTVNSDTYAFIFLDVNTLAVNPQITLNVEIRTNNNNVITIQKTTIPSNGSNKVFIGKYTSSNNSYSGNGGGGFSYTGTVSVVVAGNGYSLHSL